MLRSKICTLNMAAKQRHSRYGPSSHTAGTETHLNKIAVAAIRTIRKKSNARAGFQERKMGSTHTGSGDF
jgi:hypothetical protein